MRWVLFSPVFVVLSIVRSLFISWLLFVYTHKMSMATTAKQWRPNIFRSLFHVIPYRCTDYKSNTLSIHSVAHLLIRLTAPYCDSIALHFRWAVAALAHFKCNVSRSLCTPSFLFFNIIVVVVVIVHVVVCHPYSQIYVFSSVLFPFVAFVSPQKWTRERKRENESLCVFTTYTFSSLVLCLCHSFHLFCSCFCHIFHYQRNTKNV